MDYTITLKTHQEVAKYEKLAKLRFLLILFTVDKSTVNSVECYAHRKGRVAVGFSRSRYEGEDRYCRLNRI
jgi:hypothetical protein